METIEQPKADTEYINVSTHLREMARRHPHKRAVVYPAGWDENGRVAYTHLTFSQLDKESDCLAHGLERIGVTRGTRTILMVKPSLEFFALTFAIFKIGAVPVIVDPGMGVKRMLVCLQESKAEAFIGIPKAHLMRKFNPSYFRRVKAWVTVGKRWFWGGHSLRGVFQTPWKPYPEVNTGAGEMAAILFTTGSTGPAKGVVYTHRVFDAQIRRIRDQFGIGENEIDLPTFPLFALFDPALGMTAVIPDMDPTRPAQADPEKIIDAVLSQGVTNMFASPALLAVLAGYGKELDIKLPSLKRVISAGAPANLAQVERFASMLGEDAQVHTPYGATEAMPVLSISNQELKKTRKFTEQGFGICVGRPVGDIAVRIIRISDAPIEQWSDDLEVPDGDTGEITVKGDVVTREYFERQKDNTLSKIADGETVWHRMGDLGWRDNKGRVWFCGRKSQRVVTENGDLYTIPCEAVFNQHPAVFRSALVGVGKPPQKPIICIELENGGKGMNKDEIKKELLNYAAKHPLTQEIKTILFHKGFPVDVRHNSKIFREQLAIWAK